MATVRALRPAAKRPAVKRPKAQKIGYVAGQAAGGMPSVPGLNQPAVPGAPRPPAIGGARRRK
jgi:hypothetical protein